MVLKGDMMDSNQMQQMFETTPSHIVSLLNGYIADLLKATYDSSSQRYVVANSMSTQSPVYSVTRMDNMALTKSKPKNGIMTFNFKEGGVTITISYRLD